MLYACCHDPNTFFAYVKIRPLPAKYLRENNSQVVLGIPAYFPEVLEKSRGIMLVDLRLENGLLPMESGPAEM
jgi:hypothetical protein